MSATGTAAFDSTLNTTNVWLHDLMDCLGWEDKQRAYHAMRAVLHTLRDRLPVDQVAAFGAQLPMLVRGFYYEGWHPTRPNKERKLEDFLLHVGSAVPWADPEEVTRAVFQVVAKHVTPGEVRHVRISLPGELRPLWADGTHTLWF